MKIEEVRSKTNTELEFDLEGLKKELFELRFRNASDSSASPARSMTPACSSTRELASVS